MKNIKNVVLIGIFTLVSACGELAWGAQGSIGGGTALVIDGDVVGGPITCDQGYQGGYLTAWARCASSDATITSPITTVPSPTFTMGRTYLGLNSGATSTNLLYTSVNYSSSLFNYSTVQSSLISVYSMFTGDGVTPNMYVKIPSGTTCTLATMYITVWSGSKPVGSYQVNISGPYAADNYAYFTVPSIPVKNMAVTGFIGSCLGGTVSNASVSYSIVKTSAIL